MASSDYHFVTEWRVPGTVVEVSDILKNAADLPRWWPSVYLHVEEVEAGDANGVGRVVRLHTKGRRPYTLRWSFRLTRSAYPHGFSLEAWGDLNGAGEWTLVQDGRFVNIHYDWRVRAGKPILRYLSFLLKPVFSANYRWAMAQGEASLLRELERSRAAS